MYRIKINYVYLHEFIRRKLIYKEDLYILIQKKTYIKRLIIAKILKYEIILSCSYINIKDRHRNSDAY